MSTKPTRRKKKKEISKEEQQFSKRSLYPQPFSAATFSSFSHSQQLFSAAIISRSSQQPVSAATFSSHSQLSSCCGQGLVVSYCHQRLSSSAIIIMLLWSGVGGQLLSHHVAVVRGWWSAIDTFFRRTLSRSFRANQDFSILI